MKRVVITGLGVVSPIGNNITDFTQSLKDGICGINYTTRFDTTDYKVKVSAEVHNFDILQYASKAEARRMDLYTQYALAAASDAINDCGNILENIKPERLGVYIGSGIGGITTFVSQVENFLAKGPTKISPFFIPMIISNIASGTVAMKFNAQGPSLPIVTACATSTNTIGEAFHAIRYGYADAIIAGGAEASITPMAIAGFTNCMALSTKNIPTESSIPFDKRRDGFVMGEGAGVIILEEYEHALKRGAKIYCEIAGYANTCDAYHITAPRPDALGATNAMKLALDEAEYNPTQTVYINAHGTSTPLNDKAETMAIKNAFKEKAKDLYISSTKSMTGHMLGAAGGIEAIASTLAITENFIPPTIGYLEKDDECDLNYTPNKAVKASVDIAMSNSLGFGGHNASIVLKRMV